MRSMNFGARPGADPPPHCWCGKGLQRRLAVKDTISCGRICEMAYLTNALLVADLHTAMHTATQAET